MSLFSPFTAMKYIKIIQKFNFSGMYKIIHGTIYNKMKCKKM